MNGHVLRYRDLEDRNIVKNRPHLKNLIDNKGFPPGRRAPGSNIILWLEDEIYDWLRSLPSALEEKPAPKGAVRMRLAGEHVRSRQAKAEVA